MKDSEILKIVAQAVQQAEDAGENWADLVDQQLTAAGVGIHDEQPDGRDHDAIVRLADGREVYAETDGSGDYGLTNKVRNYLVEIDGGEGGTTTVTARNFFEAGKLAEAWAKAGEWKLAGEVTVHITSHHQTETITVEVAPCS